MLLAEAFALAVFFGGVGVGVGAAVVYILGIVGIPALNEQAMFFFAGPKLLPGVGPGELLGAFVLVLLVSLVSSLYPAWIALRVTPREAMQHED